MTNEYYGVHSTPTSDFLAHYGVKGMKWGVRKAIQKASDRMLGRHYKKAAKKLEKLNAKADINVQNAKAAKYNKIAKLSGKIGSVGAGLAVAGTGTNHTLRYINKLKKQIASNSLDEIDRKMANTTDDHLKMLTFNNEQYNKGKISEKEWKKKGDEITKWFHDDIDKYDKEWHDVRNEFNKGANKRKLAADIGRYVSYAGAGAGAVGLGTAIGAKVKAHAAKKRTTAEGHAKAVQERDAWKKEMQDAFKGTAYQNLPKVNNKKRRKSK